jgi:hypothetical protein
MSYFEEDTMRYADILNETVRWNRAFQAAIDGMILGLFNETF